MAKIVRDTDTLESVTLQLDQAVLALAAARRAGQSVALLACEVDQLTQRAYAHHVSDAYLRAALRTSRLRTYFGFPAAEVRLYGP